MHLMQQKDKMLLTGHKKPVFVSLIILAVKLHCKVASLAAEKRHMTVCACLLAEAQLHTHELRSTAEQQTDRNLD